MDTLTRADVETASPVELLWWAYHLGLTLDALVEVDLDLTAPGPLYVPDGW